MSEEVAARIRRTIEDRGPITFAEFMDLALYSPGGFYEQPQVGREGHFLTSPHVHPVFGELLAMGLRDLWAALGQPQPLSLIEVGAGDGTLARQLIHHLADVPLDYLAVERSPGARARLAELPVRVATELEGSMGHGCLLANELLDNLPFRWVRGTPSGPVEVRVGWADGRFVEVETPCDEELATMCPALGPGDEASAPTGALGLIDNIAEKLGRGYALLIDYGDDDGPTGEVHGYRFHRVVEDVLLDPGGGDITSGVDFAALARRARECGLMTLGTITQQAALIALGFDRWNEEQRARQTALLSNGAGMDAVRVWGGRSRASLLADPAGLGRLRWFALATAGLPRPAWFEKALADRRPTPD